MEITAVDLVKVLVACGVGYSVFMYGMWLALLAAFSAPDSSDAK